MDQGKSVIGMKNFLLSWVLPVASGFFMAIAFIYLVMFVIGLFI